MDDGTLQAFLDGELPEEVARAVRLAERTDPRVASRLDELRSLEAETLELLEVLDEPLSPQAIRAAEDRVLPRAAAVSGRRRRGWLRRAAAVVLLGAGVGVLAAQPFRSWLATLSEVPESPPSVSPVPDADEAPDFAAGTPAPGSVDADVEWTELGVEPLEGRLDVRIETLRPGVRVTADVGAAGRPLARAEARAQFRSGPGLIAVSHVREPVFVAIPPDVAHATVRIDGRSYLEVRGGIVTLLGPVERRAGDTLVFVAGTRPR